MEILRTFRAESISQKFSSLQQKIAQLIRGLKPYLERVYTSIQSIPIPEMDYNTIKETLCLCWLNFVVKCRNLWDYLKVMAFYYPNASFFKADFGMVLTYLFDSPFSMSKRFLMHRGEEDVYQYGETPLTTLDAIMRECQVTEKDTIYELGCGRGRTCFWLSQVLGATVVGVEYNPEFVTLANRVKNKTDASRITFRNEDMLQTDLKGATVIYLYGTTYEESFIEKLNKKFSKLPSGTKIITVSYPLTDYADSSSFEVMKRFSARFTWGEGDVYLHIVK